MSTKTIKHVTFGEGMPKICVPITESTQEEILNRAQEIRFLPCDVVEWRADFYEEARRPSRVLETLAKLRAVLDQQLLLFTFRTAKEGGQLALDPYDYLWLNQKVAESELPDLIDLEFAQNPERAAAFVRFAHRKGVHVIVSSHNFEKTKPVGDLVARLVEMQESQADFVKLAVMPQSRRDVLALLSATLEMQENHPACPVITMSMGKDGQISRFAGEVFGSCMTFGAAGRTSAPGQPDVTDLSIALQILHK